MNKPVESVLVHLFRVPVGPPEAPSGAHERVEVMRASPRFFKYRLIGITIGTALFALVEFGFAIAALVAGRYEPILIAAALLLLALPGLTCAYLALRIDFDLRYYVLTDKSLRVREGAWVVDEKTITYANVQNVRVTQGPLQRLFGISDVRVDTAGGGAVGGKHGATGAGHNVVIAGIENAAAVRDEILAHLRLRSVGAGLGDLDDERFTRSRAARFSAVHVAELRELASSTRALLAAVERPR